MAVGCWLLLLLKVVSVAALEEELKQNFSDKCMNDTNSFLWQLNQQNPEEFALVMYDSYGRMGSNFLGGNYDQTGRMTECRSAQTSSFSGQYCKVYLAQGKSFYFVGICVPDSCEEKEVHTLAHGGRLKFGEVSLIPPLPSTLANHSTQSVVRTQCLPKVVNPRASGIVCLVLCCVLVALPLAATLTTAMQGCWENREVAPAVEPSSLSTNVLDDYSLDDHNMPTQQSCFRRCLQQFLQAFSLQTTTQGIFSTPASVTGVYPSLNGIRALSMLWIISGHNVNIAALVIDNMQSLVNELRTNPLHVLAIGGARYVAVDTFLLLGGLLSAKGLLSSIQRNDDTMSPSLVADYFFKRIMRIQPLHMFAVLFVVALLSVISGGPFLPFISEYFLDCDKYWWTNLLLINNLFSHQISCLPWTWYLALDIQSYATTPLLILAHRKNKGVFAVLVVALLLMTILTSSILTALKHLPVFQSEWTDEYNFYYYVKPYSRYGPFLIGILFGMYLKKRKENLLKKKWQVALGWICSLSVLALVVGLSYALMDTPDYPSAPHAIYQGLHRIAWVMALTWVILACEEGCGGLIMRFLSLSIWVPLSNLSFACYIVHPVGLLLYAGLQETQIHYSDGNFMYIFLGNVLLSVIMAYVVNVLVEKPFSLLKWKRK